MEDLTRILSELRATQNNIEKILERSENYKSDIQTMNLKFDLLKDEIENLNKIMYGDNRTDPLLSRIKLQDLKIKDLEEELHFLKEESRNQLERDKNRFQKIMVAVIGGTITIISSGIAYFLDFGSSKQ